MLELVTECMLFAPAGMGSMAAAGLNGSDAIAIAVGGIDGGPTGCVLANATTLGLGALGADGTTAEVAGSDGTGGGAHAFVPWLVSSLLCAAVCMPGLILFKAVWGMREWPLLRACVREPTAAEREGAAVLLQAKARGHLARRGARQRRAQARLNAVHHHAAVTAIQAGWRRRMAAWRAQLEGEGVALGREPVRAAAVASGAEDMGDGAQRGDAYALQQRRTAALHELSALDHELFAKAGALHSERRAAPAAAHWHAPHGRLVLSRLDRLESLRRLRASPAIAVAVKSGGPARQYARLSDEGDEGGIGGGRSADELESARRGTRVAPGGTRAKRVRALRRRRVCRLSAVWFDALAWVAMFGCYALCAAVVLVYADVFGEEQTTELLLSWSGAMGQTFVLQEPFWLAVVVGLPHTLRFLSALPCVGGALGALEALGIETEGCVESLAWLSDAC